MKKIVSLLLVLMICLCFITACNSNSNETPVPSDTSFQNTDNSVKANDSTTYITIAEDKKINCQIVFSSNAKETVKSAAGKLSELLGKKSGGGIPEVHDDFLSVGQQPDSTSFEILIGNTVYPETSRVREKIKYGDWKICFEGNKLVVAAYSEQALQSEMTELIVAIKDASRNDGSIRLPDNFTE